MYTLKMIGSYAAPLKMTVYNMKLCTGYIFEQTGNAVDFAIENVSDTVLIHVVNCENEINTGIAAEIKNRIPAAYFAYKHVFVGLEGNIDALGGISYTSGKNGTPHVINLYAQETFGYDGKRYLNYGALGDCLGKVRDMLVESLHEDEPTFPEYIRRVVFPYNMGCDRAGGDWEIVHEMIEHYLFMHELHSFKLDFKR